jgi:cytochrome P450
MRALVEFLAERQVLVILVTVSLLLYLCRHISQVLALKRKRAEVARSHGCKPLLRWPHIDPLFGFDLLYPTMKALKKDLLMDEIDRRFYDVIPGGAHTYGFVLFGNTDIMTCDPENIKTVLATNFKDYELPQQRKVAFSKNFGSGIFSSDGKEWEHSRAMLRPNFNRSQVDDLLQLEPHVQNLIRRIPKDGRTVDLQPIFPDLTMDSASELLFGESTYCLLDSSDEGAKFSAAFDYLSGTVAKDMQLGHLDILSRHDSKLQDAVMTVTTFVDKFVNKALKYRQAHPVGAEEKSDLEMETSGEKGRYVFLHELAKTDYGAKKIRVELLSVLTAGRDTTAGLLSLLWYTLARYPDVTAKLRKEIEYLGSEPPTLEQLKDLKYLRWTINERKSSTCTILVDSSICLPVLNSMLTYIRHTVLRLRPIIPINSRTCIVDTILPLGGGPDGKSPTLVKAGTRIIFSIHALHRRKDLYGEDADLFLPERWEAMKPGYAILSLE